MIATAEPVDARLRARAGRSSGVFACTRKDRLITRSGSPYLALELRDRSGTIPARAFRDADALAGRFERGDLVRVSRAGRALPRRARARGRRHRAGRGRRRIGRRPDARSCRPPTATSTSSTASSSTSRGEVHDRRYRALLDGLLGDRGAARGLAPGAVHARRPPRLPRRAARAHGRRGDARARGLPAAPAPQPRPAADRRDHPRPRPDARVHLRRRDRADRGGAAARPPGDRRADAVSSAPAIARRRAPARAAALRALPPRRRRGAGRAVRLAPRRSRCTG